MQNVASLNTQIAYEFTRAKPRSLIPGFQGAIFGDIAYGTPLGSTPGYALHYVDAGASAILRGALYDRSYVIRIDVPVLMDRPELAPGREASSEQVKFRWTFTVGDLW